MRSNKKERQGRGCSEALQTIVWLSADARCDEFFYPLASTFEFRFHQSPCSLHLNIVSLVTTNESIVKDRYTAYLTKATIRANSLPPPLYFSLFHSRALYTGSRSCTLPRCSHVLFLHSSLRHFIVHLVQFLIDNSISFLFLFLFLSFIVHIYFIHCFFYILRDLFHKKYWLLVSKIIWIEI